MLKVGIVVANDKPWSGPGSMAQIAKRAEELGFHSIWVADHVVLPEGFRSVYPYAEVGFTAQEAETSFEPLLVLGYLAASTRSIRLGTSVLVAPIRHPVYTAKLLSTLDQLSGGRLTLGLGCGWLEEEFAALGYRDFSMRGEVLEEHVRIYRTLWTNEVATHRGLRYEFSGLRLSPKPVQLPTPPIWIGGNSSTALRRAASIGNGWHPVNLSSEEVATRVELLQTHLRNAGRNLADFEVAPRCQVGLDQPAAIGERNAIVGSAQHVAGRLHAYELAGCSCLVLEILPAHSLESQLNGLDRLAHEVMPVLASLTNDNAQAGVNYLVAENG